jgi:hypothetical protein
MPLQNYDLQVDQNCDWSISFVFASPDPSGLGNVANAVYYNLSGTTLSMDVRETDNASSAILLALTLGAGLTLYTGTLPGGLPVAPANPNGFSITITNAQSSSIPPGVYAFDVIGTSGGLKTCYLKGSFTLRATVGRP